MSEKYSREDLFIALTVEGERHVHATDHNGGYATMCGLDGYDRGQSVEGVMPTEKITCPQCRSIWGNAKRYRSSDFADHNREV